MLANSPIADLTAQQWRMVTARSLSREFAMEQAIENPSNFAIWLIASGGVCIANGQERQYFQQGQILAVDGMMGDFSVSNNTHLICLNGAALAALSQACPHSANVLYQLASKQQFQGEVLELIEQFCGPLRLSHRTEILAACQWRSVAAGDVLVNRAERCFHWHIVLHGKLCGFRRSICQQDLENQQLSETYSDEVDLYRLRGDCFGQTALLGSGEYQMSFVAETAVRLVMFHRDIFDLLWQHYDNFKQIIATELAMSHALPIKPDWGDKIVFTSLGQFERHSEVLSQLVNTNQQDTGTLHIEFEQLAEQLGLPLQLGSMNRHPGWYTIYRWWQEQLDKPMYLIADQRYSAWQSFCIANANRVIAVADSHGDIEQINPAALAPRFGIERWLLLCHRYDTRRPVGTLKWLNKLAHPKFLHWRFEHYGDSARVMRTIKGCALAVLFSGGYQSTLAQIGVLRRAKEQKIQADVYVGHGFAALLAAFCASNQSPEKIYQYLIKDKQNQGVKGLTWSRKDSLNSIEFRRIVASYFSNINIEDMWLPFYCTGINENDDWVCSAQGKLRHAFKGFASPHIVSQNHNHQQELEFLRQITSGNVIVLEHPAKSKSASSAVSSFNPLSRWFADKQVALEAKLELIESQRNGGELIDGQKNMLTLILAMQLPNLPVSNMLALKQLVDLGYQQSEQLFEAIIERNTDSC